MKKLSLKLLMVCIMLIPAILTFAQEMSRMPVPNGILQTPVQSDDYQTGNHTTPIESVKSVLLSEDFTDGACPAAGWEVTPAGNTNWALNEGTYAGGTSPEGKFYYFPVFTGNTKMITPVINTSAYATLELEFKHNLSGAGNSDYSLKVETTSDGGTTWNEVWSVTPAGNIAAQTLTISIENSDVGSENFQFCLTYESTVNYGAYNWYFDDIVLTGTPLAEEYSVTFNVEDEDENPIEGAEIVLEGNGTLSTDASGQAVFEDVAPGTFTYDITASGFVLESGSVIVTDADVIVDVMMETASGSTVLLSEDFTAGACPAAGWEVTPVGNPNWVINEGTNAGGTAPQGKFYYFPVFTGNTKMITPVINTSAYATLELEFKHNLSGAGNSDYSLKVETTSDGGTTWNEVWSVTPAGNIAAQTLTISIENSDVGTANFQFCLTYESTVNYGAYNWYFDDIVLTGTGGSDVYSVTYNVKDEDENPIEDAEIAMGVYGTLSTDASGQAVFVDVAPGTYTWDVTADGFVEQSGTVTVTDTDVIVDVELETLIPVFPFYEDFSSGAFGPEWTIVGGGDANWNVNAYWSNAGGEPPEAYFGWSPSFTGNSKLVTPVLSTTGISSLLLEFKHKVWDYAGSGYSYKIETTSDGGTTWNEIWSVSPTGDIGPETLTLLIENDDIGSDNFQLAFTFEGSTSQINDWFLDDISITVPLPAILLEEDFSSGAFAPGWAIVGGGAANWNVNAYWSNAGGVAPEAAFSWGPPHFTGNSKLVTPEIATAGYSSLLLEFKHYLWDNAGSAYSLKVETTSDGGTTWNEVWSVSPTGDIGPETLTLLIDNDDVGSNDFQFALTFDGYSGQLNHWFFDDILLSNGTGPTTYSVTYLVKDENENPIEGAQVNMQNGGTKITDASGEAVFENVFPGTYTWDVFATTFAPESGTVTVTDSDVTVDVEMGIAVELLSEHFEGSFPPPGWSKFGDGQSNWNKSNSTNAGGLYPEVRFNGSPNFTGNSKLLTPEIATSNYSALFLEFKQYLMDNLGSGYAIKVETTSDGGTTWNEVWSVSPTGDIGPESLILLINNDDVGSDNFQLAFTFDGNSAQIDKWYFDDVVLTRALTYDAGVISIDAPALAISGTVIDPAANVKNMGSETITFDVTFEIIDGTAVYSEMVTVNDLAPLGVETLTFPAWTTVEGGYVAEVTVDLAGDENPENDILSQNLDVANGLVPLKPLFELFTSSTCSPCPVTNNIIDSILGENPNEYALIKYQMDWPGAGDPYYTEEGGVRRDYYGLQWVPDLYINADQIYPASSFTQEIFDEHSNTETALEIDITETSMDDDNIISISADLTSIINYDEGLTAHIVVVEKLTTGNVGTNGETEFHYVMMKMLPDASGTTLGALTSGVPLTLTESFDMDETNMETPDDIAVIVFVQDDSDMSIIQSEMRNVNDTQNFGLSEGYQFISSGVIPNDPDILLVMDDVLNDNLDFVRNSQGLMLRKIGPNWINGIGDWIVSEGYLVKMNAEDSFAIEGLRIDPSTGIPVILGYQFISYFPENQMDALVAFETIIGDDLDFIRDSQGLMLRKIGPNWINGIGDAMPGEGYLVKMLADGEIIYPAAAKSSGMFKVNPSHLIFEGGNAADPVYTIYISGLSIGDEVAAYDGMVMVGSTVIVSENTLENALPIFSTLTSQKGYVDGNNIILNVWDDQLQSQVSSTYTFVNEYEEAYLESNYPSEDGEFSVINITKGASDNIDVEANVSIYPNPASDVLNVVANTNINRVRIINFIGQIMFDNIVNNSSININTSAYQSGVYIISVETSNRVITEKITIK